MRRTRRITLIHRVFAGSLVSLLVGHAPAAATSAPETIAQAYSEDPDATELHQRIERVRAHFSEHAISTEIVSDEEGAQPKRILAQWYNWQNWPNYWNDWGNWWNY